jgi:transcription elongation factor
MSEYQANDLILYSNKYVGVVLKVEEDYLKVINNESEMQNVKISDITKKIE